MIIFTKQGNRQDVPYLFAYLGGVYIFEFYGDETFTDTYDSSIWYWTGTDNSAEEILGIAQDDGTQLIESLSLSDCISLEGSFFWDNANGYIYVHWYNSYGDWSISREGSSLSQIVAGYASGYSDTTKNIYDGVYYDPVIIEIDGLKKTVDPMKFGLISFSESSLTLSNENGQFDNLSENQVVGVPIWFYFTDEEETELRRSDRVFTGYLNGYTNNHRNAVFRIIEVRFFENKPVCPNSLSIDDYPYATKYEGKTMPTAWGKIRRGIVMPVNSDQLTDAGSGTATFLVADPSLYAIKAVTALYDSDDAEVTIDSYDLNACTISFTKSAGESVSNLKKYKWEGQGYVISGTYNNGLDIIKAAFLSLANIPYLVSTYIVSEYDQSIADNTQSVGISVQSDSGFIEGLVEPITTSLQGIIDIQGDGRITWKSRNPSNPISEIVYRNSLIGEPSITVSTSETVSELTATYYPDFTDNDNSLSYTYSDSKYSTIGNYAINRKDPLSPVETILTEQADVISVLSEIMETSSSPIRTLSAKSNQFLDSDLFDCIGIDEGRSDSENIFYGEILSISPVYIEEEQSYVIREIETPIFAPGHNNGSLMKDYLLKDRLMGAPKN